MKRTVGSAEAWEFLASTARFPSERSENVPVFPTNLPFIWKAGRRTCFHWDNSHFLERKRKIKVWCYKSIDEKISSFFLEKKQNKEKRWGKFAQLCFLTKTRAFSALGRNSHCSVCKLQQNPGRGGRNASQGKPSFLLILHKSIFLWKRSRSDLFHFLDAEIK